MRTCVPPLKLTAPLSYLLVSLLLSGCGGGTTGTSSLGESSAGKLLIVGSTQNEAGVPLANTDMAVRSGESEEVLAETKTQAAGDFSVEISGDVPSLVLEMGNLTTPTFERTFTGSGAITTAIAIQPSGTPEFLATLEVKPSSSCPEITVEGNDFYRKSLPVSSPCPIALRIATSPLSPSQFGAYLAGDCRESTTSTVEVLSELSVSPGGLVTLDLAPYLNRGGRPACRDLSLTLFATEGANLPTLTFAIRG